MLLPHATWVGSVQYTHPAQHLKMVDDLSIHDLSVDDLSVDDISVDDVSVDYLCVDDLSDLSVYVVYPLKT